MTMKPEVGSQGRDPKIAGSPWKLERLFSFTASGGASSLTPESCTSRL